MDTNGTITLANDEARRLLGVPASAVGRPVSEAIPPGRVRDILGGSSEGPDETVVTGERVLVVNRMPTYVRGEVTGAVITFRDRTELEGMHRELDGLRGVADALRAQAHEFSNRLHTIVGLVEMGRHGEAIALSTDEAIVHQGLVESLLERIEDPTLSALLLAKAVVAGERGIILRISEDTLVADELPQPRDVITVVGNLIDNAIDAVASHARATERWVSVSVRQDDRSHVVQVHDSGPGIDAADAARIFEDGVSTKHRNGERVRGLGLALVDQVVRRRGGKVRVSNDGGAVFTVHLPLTDEREAPSAPAEVTA